VAVSVRRIQAHEEDVLKEIRLAALLDSPSAFGSTYAAEAPQPSDHWQSRAALGASGSQTATFFAVIHQSVIGLVAGYRADPAGSTVELVSMWVATPYRQAGVGRQLVDAVLDWARDTGASRVELWVTRGNDQALRLYESGGFSETGEHQPLPSDPRHEELRMRIVLV
jgi:ribosomal protein S18 acetylase RimI-like enzyme